MKNGDSEKEHEFCKRCGRKLRNPDARKLGYGAICFKKMQSSGKRLFVDIAKDYSYHNGNIKSSQ